MDFLSLVKNPINDDQPADSEVSDLQSGAPASAADRNKPAANADSAVGSDEIVLL